MEKIYSSMEARRKFISPETIDAINQLSPETLEAHGVIQKARSSGYICPECGNGSGKDGTGIKPLVTNSHVGWKCHRCNEKFNNMDFLARHYGLNKTANFRELCESICDDFNIPLDYDAPLGNKVTEKKSAVPPAELIAINDDLNSDIQSLKDFVAAQGGLWRGLPIEILEKFGCRYISNWTTPKSRAAQKADPAHDHTRQCRRFALKLSGTLDRTEKFFRRVRAEIYRRKTTCRQEITFQSRRAYCRHCFCL